MDSIIEQEQAKLDRQFAEQIPAYPDGRVLTPEDTRVTDERLKGHYRRFWRSRVEDWRIFVEFQEAESKILLVHAGHRSSTYDRWRPRTH
jgi:mRNA interferase RelE/StbE